MMGKRAGRAASRRTRAKAGLAEAFQLVTKHPSVPARLLRSTASFSAMCVALAFAPSTAAADASYATCSLDGTTYTCTGLIEEFALDLSEVDDTYSEIIFEDIYEWDFPSFIFDIDNAGDEGSSHGDDGEDLDGLTVVLDTDDASVTINGDDTDAIVSLETTGGAGHSGKDRTDSDSSGQGGNSGDGGSVTGAQVVEIIGGTVDGYTFGAASGASVVSEGGDSYSGGDGRSYGTDNSTGGDGGVGGDASEAELIIYSDATFEVLSDVDDTPGVYIQSAGGSGGDGGKATGGTNTYGGDGGDGGDGGQGSFAAELGAQVTIETQGDRSHGIEVLSSGGDGGDGGNGVDSLFNAYGGDGGGGGSAGNVSFTVTDDDSAVDITTTGEDAIGILARSYGGAGGDGGDGDSDLASGKGGASDEAGPAGEVFVSFQGSITTTGDGSSTDDDGDDFETTSSGILAQSVGGFAGDAGDAEGTFTSYGASSESAGDAGTVTVEIASGTTITTSGSYSDAIEAQSIGGGGGLAGDANGVIAGSSASAQGNEGSGGGGAVSITQSGTITASGEGSVGIFAQSAGYDGNAQAITVQVNGTVIDGTGANGAAVVTSGGTSANTVAVGTDGVVVAGTGGQAIVYEDLETSAAAASKAAPKSDPSTLLVDNSGIIAGSISLHASGGPVGGTILNNASGTLRGGAVYAGNMTNAGTVEIGDRGITGVTRLTGDFAQVESGTLQFGVDFAAGRSDILSVEGDADIAGYFAVNPGTLAPNVELEVMNVAGTLTGAAEAAASSAVVYELRQDNGRLKLSVADTRFETAFDGLNESQRNIGAYMDRIFDTSSGTYGTLLGDLDRLGESDATGSTYAQSLTLVSPGGSQAAVAAQTQLAQGRLGKVLSCPSFSGDAAILEEKTCAWTTVGAANVDQDGAPGYDGSVFGIATGGQFEIQPDLFVGLAAGYESSSYNGDYGASHVDGDTGFVAAAIKRQWGGLLISGAVSASYGAFDTTRSIDLPSFDGVARGDMDVTTFSGRVRAAYTMGSERAYVRPVVDLDVVSTHASGYDERDAGAYNLRIESESQTAFIATPALELGTRQEFSDGWVARGFVRGGVSFSTEDSWETSASLSQAAAGSGTFDSAIPIADIVGRVAAGAQLTHVGGFDVTAEYEGAFGSGFASHSGTLKISYRF